MRRSRITAVMTLVVMVFSMLAITIAPAHAQRTTSGKKAGASTGKGPEKLDKEKVKAKLEAFKKKIAVKAVPKNIRKQGDKRLKKWLSGFQVVQSKHYLVYTNGPKTTVKRFAKGLEELYEFMRKKWPFEHLDHHLPAYIFKSKEEYFTFCVEVAGWSYEAASGTAGHANGSYYATYYQSPKSSVVMHEAAHEIVMGCMKVPGIGSWFQEGMAVYIEKSILGGRVSGGMRADLRNGHYYPLPEFMEIKSLIRDKHSLRNYDHAGCLIEFMLETKDPRMKGKFSEFLKRSKRQYGRGAQFSERLFKDVYGMTAAEVDSAFLDFHKIDKKRRKKAAP